MRSLRDTFLPKTWWWWDGEEWRTVVRRTPPPLGDRQALRAMYVRGVAAGVVTAAVFACAAAAYVRSVVV